MNNWKTNSLQYSNSSGSHQRSASTIGYNDLMYPGYETIETVPRRNENNLVNQYCTSYVDISKSGDMITDSRRQFSWRSPAGNVQSHLNSKQSSQQSVQRPFENAFKAAISKMKESSVYRLSDVNKSAKDSTYITQNNNDATYARNCVTLQPRKTTMDSRVPRSTHKIFRCNSSSGRVSDDVSSINSAPFDFGSEAESERHEVDCQYMSNRSNILDHSHHQEETMKHVAQNNCAINCLNSNSGSGIVLPVQLSSSEKSSVVSEVYISPKVVNKSQSAFPRTERLSVDNEDSPECEPLPSVQDIIAKVEALTNDKSNRTMSKLLTVNSDKPPSKKPQRSSSQKIVEDYSSLNQIESLPTPGKKLSGLYKKGNPTAIKGNSLNNMPFDFQKLHSAFLEQKQEIQNLKRELDEKKVYIIQLETEIRQYEPWR